MGRGLPETRTRAHSSQDSEAEQVVLGVGSGRPGKAGIEPGPQAVCGAQAAVSPEAVFVLSPDVTQPFAPSPLTFVCRLLTLRLQPPSCSPVLFTSATMLTLALYLMGAPRIPLPFISISSRVPN